jgi:hypothetical protein
MTLTAAGNLGIGTTSPATKLDVSGTARAHTVTALPSGDTNGLVTIQSSGAAVTRILQFRDSSGVSSGEFSNLNASFYYDAITGGNHNFRVNGVSKGTFDSDGLKFNGDTAAANALDDYEEGAWTPVIVGGTTAGTYTLSGTNAYYTKIGNKVTVFASFGFSAASGGTGNIRVNDLPFAYKANTASAAALSVGNVDITTAPALGVFIAPTTGSSATALFPYAAIDNAGVEEIPIAGVTTSSSFTFVFEYTTS